MGAVQVVDLGSNSPGVKQATNGMLDNAGRGRLHIVVGVVGVAGVTYCLRVAVEIFYATILYTNATTKTPETMHIVCCHVYIG